MKKKIFVNNQIIETEFSYKVDDVLIFDIDDSTQIELEVVSYDKPIILDIKNNLNISITTLLDCSELDISYLIGEGSNVNEFVLSQKDDIEINCHKKVKLLDNASYEASNGYFSDSDINLNVVVDLDGINAKAMHNSAVISRFNAKKEMNITINSNVRQTYGELNNFGVVKDSAKLIFNGTGFIKNKASQSQAHQESKIITFDPGVEAQANPFLIIDESDVEASHAAAVGKMDEEQLFYLQSRGLTLDTASRLITYGYLKPVLAKINDVDLKEKLENLIEEKVGL